MVQDRGQALRLVKQHYGTALVEGAGVTADRALDDALSKGVPPIELYLQIVLGTFAEAGKMFESGELSADEYQEACDTTIRQMERLRRTILRATPLKKKALVVLIADRSEVEHRMLPDFLFLDGWDVEVIEVLDAASLPVLDEGKPGFDLLVIGVSLESSLMNVRELIGIIRRKYPALPLLLEGNFFVRNPTLEEGLNVDAIARDAAHAMEEARRISGLNPVGPTLEQYLQMLGNRIHLRRRMLGMSQQQLADTAGMDRAYISLVERGKQNVSIGAVMKLSTALRVPLTELLGQGDPELFQDPRAQAQQQPVGPNHVNASV